VNVSGGDPLEVQLSVREEPTTLLTADVDGRSISGAAVYGDKMVNNSDQVATHHHVTHFFHLSTNPPSWSDISLNYF